MNIRNLIFTISVLLIPIISFDNQLPEYKIRETIPYQIAFSVNSLVTTISIVCSANLPEGKNWLRQSILSYFYYNTYPIKHFFLIDYCSNGTAEATKYLQNSLPKDATDNSQLITIIQLRGGFITAIDQVFSKVNTKYVFLIPSNWITVDGFGILDQSVQVLQYANQNNLKISQVTQLYPLWGQYRYLSKMMKTKTGTKFHEIGTFKPSNRYYITFNPSLLNFEYLYTKVFEKDLLGYSQRINCNQDKDCFEKQLSSDIFTKKGYYQVFINNGLETSNVLRSY